MLCNILLVYLFFIINSLDAFSSILKSSKRLNKEGLVFLANAIKTPTGDNIDTTSSKGIVSKISKSLKVLLDGYNSLLEKYPYRTKFISSGIVGGTGDILIQYVTSHAWEAGSSGFVLDIRRLSVFTAVAAFYIAPVINIWFNWLNSLPYPKNFNNFSKALAMMVADQTIGATVITAGFFFAFELAQVLFPPYSSIINLKSVFAAGLRSTEKNLWTTLIVNWYCWPVINFVNFLVIPLRYRVLFSNFAAVFWNMFLSNVANNN